MDIDATLKFSGLTLDDPTNENSTEADVINYYRLQLILDLIRGIDVNEIQNVDTQGRINIKNTIRSVCAQNLIANNINDFVDCTGTNPLSYTEKKAFHQHLKYEVERKLTPIQKRIEEIKAKHPHIMESAAMHRNKLIELEKQRQSKIGKLLELKIQRRELLVKLIDRRLSPAMENEMKLKLLEFKQNQLKANSMRIILEMENLQPTKYAEKAIHDVDKEIQKLVEEKRKKTADLK